jgi:hypothetical protein
MCLTKNWERIGNREPWLTGGGFWHDRVVNYDAVEAIYMVPAFGKGER